MLRLYKYQPYLVSISLSLVKLYLFYNLCIISRRKKHTSKCNEQPHAMIYQAESHNIHTQEVIPDNQTKKGCRSVVFTKIFK